jgi:hypothetical protein
MPGTWIGPPDARHFDVIDAEIENTCKILAAAYGDILQVRQ